MSKMIVTEETLKRIINEAIEKRLEEGRFRDAMGKVFNGIKGGAQAVGAGISQAVKDPVGTYGSVRGWMDQQQSTMQSRFRDAYNMARDRVRAQNVNRNPWANISPEEKQAILQVRGRDEFGNQKFPMIRYAKTLKMNGYSLNQIAAIMTEKGFKNVTPQYARKLVNVGVPKKPRTNNGEVSPAAANATAGNGGPQANPVVQNNQGGVQRNMGGGAGMDYSIEEAVANAIKKFINEVGDTPKGQNMLGRLERKRMEQWADNSRKANKATDDAEAKKYNDKKVDALKRATAAYTKARDERDAKFKDGDPIKHHYVNAYKSGVAKKPKK